MGEEDLHSTVTFVVFLVVVFAVAFVVVVVVFVVAVLGWGQCGRRRGEIGSTVKIVPEARGQSGRG